MYILIFIFNLHSLESEKYKCTRTLLRYILRTEKYDHAFTYNIKRNWKQYFPAHVDVENKKGTARNILHH